LKLERETPMPIFCPITEYVSRAMNNAAPRSVEAVIRDRFPEATIDRNGRPHAPHDGYVDEVTGNVYRGGEYLPFEIDRDEVESKYAHSRPSLSVFDGITTHIFEGTKGQVKAGREAAKEVMREFDALSEFVGEVGKRNTFTVRLMNVFVDYGNFGTEYTHMFRDNFFNNIIWKASVPLFKTADGKIERFYQTAPFEIVATVKSHWQSKTDERSATYLTRVSLVK
jgi:hypothetical protein